MPIYVYRCIECDRYTEVLCKYEERDNLQACEYCGGDLNPVISSFMNDYRPSHSRFVKTVDDD